MANIKNVMEIYQHLEKSNCKKCNEPTCLAFAAAVFKGQKGLKECPHLDERIVAQYSEKTLRHLPLNRIWGKK